MSEVLDTHDSLGLADLVKKRKVSATELLEAAIARAEALNPRFNFMAQKHYDYGRKAIAAGLPQGPFSGVPWLLKDLNTYIAGEVTENGSRLYKGQRASVTSELVRRIERAGFVIFGKTTTPEFGLTGTTESVANGPTRNPWNPERIAGGSSGGAAAAVAAGVIPAAHATDGGGSIRIPASACGLFGLKPSRGRVPMGPARTEGWGGMSVHHAVSRTVRDSAAILDATHGVEPGSRYSAPTPERPYLQEVGRDPGKLRIALMLTPNSGAPVDPEVVEATRAAARLLESLGHHVEEAAPKIDMAAIGASSFALMASSVAADCVDRARALGIELGPDVLERTTLDFIAMGKSYTGMDYARGNNAYQAAAVTIAQFMERWDVILSPTLSAPPLPLGRIGLDTGRSMMDWGREVGTFTAFTGIYNGTGQPAMSLPLAMSKDGLPIGVMVTGRYGEEGLLFRLAGQVEKAAPWIGRRAKV
ncbi:amidase [Novosphingobium taihuense]|uniref:Asp-tRNA(Asn)/Glu-tRNA(Gln) amidotransferase A subunit family amidase n=1 Tax=Novosphingobium taihuense TaxID=260085 RepID=A0A7W7AC25_9SPHN|nr:amidase family protein [Novosphingobium taihuense]MBB4614091.1 Asp-tRNA(Asn)/Glu-tRNA(Gln) amidotransferase A subunit family amidase [Novosphingobium taihuense]TWH86941.1 amidase/6-aminohexanoate-cyclic-dimer hydrolase [Novosphingobium taihuense]